MTRCRPRRSGRAAVRHVPDPAVVAAYAAAAGRRRGGARRAGRRRTPAQERLRRDYLEHLAAHPDGVAKAGPPAHLTASCVVLDPTGDRVLLTLHRRANAWFQFGGHLEAGDSSLWAAARREAREESGIDALEPLPRPVQLDRHRLVGSFGGCREHLDVRYAAVATAGRAGRGSARSRTTCAGGRSTRCPRAPAPSSRPLVSLARDALGLG